MCVGQELGVCEVIVCVLAHVHVCRSGTSCTHVVIVCVLAHVHVCRSGTWCIHVVIVCVLAYVHVCRSDVALGLYLLLSTLFL